MNTVAKLYALLTLSERRKAALLLCLVLLMALFEAVGVASIMPFVAVLSDPSLVLNNVHLSVFFEPLNFKGTQEFQVFFGVVFFIFFIGSTLFKALTAWCLVRFTYFAQYSISKRLVEKYLRQPYDWFLNRHSGDLGKTVLSEVDQVIAEALLPLLNLIAQAALVAAIVILLIAVNPILVLSSFAFVVVAYGLIYLGLRARLMRFGQNRVQANKERFSIVNEAFGGIKEIKLHGLEQAFLSRFEAPAKAFAFNKSYVQIATQIPRYLLEILVFGVAILLLLLMVLQSSSSMPAMLPFISLYAFATYRLMPAMQQVYSNLSTLRFAHHAVNHLHNDMLSGAQVNYDFSDLCDASKKITVDYAIEFDRVSYAYPGHSSMALNQLSFNLPARSTVGFVGSSGAGKTTLADLLLGLLSPVSGQIRVDGVDIHACKSLWQQKIGYVPQSIFLVDDTIAANIAFGVPSDQIDLAQVEKVARIANLHDFVAEQLELGYQTKVGERGVRLSGGQRQRIGIARALYNNPEVLVFDEATSALDNKTESVVMAAVQALNHQITIVMIAHRLSTLKVCDVVFLIESGQLVEQGSYDELMAGHRAFNRLQIPTMNAVA